MGQGTGKDKFNKMAQTEGTLARTGNKGRRSVCSLGLIHERISKVLRINLKLKLRCRAIEVM